MLDWLRLTLMVIIQYGHCSYVITVKVHITSRQCGSECLSVLCNRVIYDGDSYSVLCLSRSKCYYFRTCQKVRPICDRG